MFFVTPAGRTEARSKGLYIQEDWDDIDPKILENLTPPAISLHQQEIIDKIKNFLDKKEEMIQT